MLETIRLKNFKLHEDTTINFRPITVFIGPNNSGKSSIFHAVQLLQQQQLQREKGCHLIGNKKSSSSPPRYPNQIVDVGDYDDVVRDSNKELGIVIKGEFTDGAQILIDMAFFKNNLSKYRGEIKTQDKHLSWDADFRDYNIIRFMMDPEEMVFEGAKITFSKKSSLAELIIPEVPISYTIEEWSNTIDNLVSQFLKYPDKMLHSIITVHGLRGFEESPYPLPEDALKDLFVEEVE